MLWREAYRTRAEENVSRPPLAGESLDGSPFALGRGVLLIAFSSPGYRQRALWERLLVDELGDGARMASGVALPVWTRRDVDALLATTPPSARARTYRWIDEDRAWRTLASPRSEEDVLAAVADVEALRLALVGPPTEEALEAFLACWRGIGG